MDAKHYYVDYVDYTSAFSAVFILASFSFSLSLFAARSMRERETQRERISRDFSVIDQAHSAEGVNI